jgi:hypothetical protein
MDSSQFPGCEGHPVPFARESARTRRNLALCNGFVNRAGRVTSVHESVLDSWAKGPGCLDEKQKRLTFWASRSLESAKEIYFASFFGLHFSQVLPSLAAFTQHLCSQVLPAAFAFSQQDSARATLTEAIKARAQATATNDLIAFIYFYLLFASNPDWRLSSFPTFPRSDPASRSDR